MKINCLAPPFNTPLVSVRMKEANELFSFLKTPTLKGGIVEWKMCERLKIGWFCCFKNARDCLVTKFTFISFQVIF